MLLLSVAGMTFRAIKSFRLELDGPEDAVFSSGEVVSGQVVLELRSAIRVQSMKVLGRGVANAHWLENRSVGMNSIYNDYTSKITYFRKRQHLIRGQFLFHCAGSDCLLFWLFFAFIRLGTEHQPNAGEYFHDFVFQIYCLQGNINSHHDVLQINVVLLNEYSSCSLSEPIGTKCSCEALPGVGQKMPGKNIYITIWNYSNSHKIKPEQFILITLYTIYCKQENFNFYNRAPLTTGKIAKMAIRI